MPRDEAARQSSRLGPIQVPDQLQQTRRTDAAPAGGTTDQKRAPRETSPRQVGILEQLKTERGHD